MPYSAVPPPDQPSQIHITLPSSDPTSTLHPRLGPSIADFLRFSHWHMLLAVTKSRLLRIFVTAHVPPAASARHWSY